MNGYVTYWSKDYLKELEKNGDVGPFRVVYGSRHLRMPSISSLKIGDVIYPVCIKEKTLCVLARLQIEKIEPAFDYSLRETGAVHGTQVPEGILVKSQGGRGEYYCFCGGRGCYGEVELPDNIHTEIDEDELEEVPHQYHQEPTEGDGDIAASGTGTMFEDHIIPIEDVHSFLFGKTPKTQKPLSFDKNGGLLSTLLSGHVRKMSKETLEYFESLFK